MLFLLVVSSVVWLVTSLVVSWLWSISSLVTSLVVGWLWSVSSLVTSLVVGWLWGVSSLVTSLVVGWLWSVSSLVTSLVVGWLWGVSFLVTSLVVGWLWSVSSLLFLWWVVVHTFAHLLVWYNLWYNFFRSIRNDNIFNFWNIFKANVWNNQIADSFYFSLHFHWILWDKDTFAFGDSRDDHDWIS